MPSPQSRSWTTALIYANAFLLGAVIMGFEMLGSRYLFPYFGGTIVTWAALISAVLAALMIGYFAGGALADRYPTTLLPALLLCFAALYLGLVPASATGAMLWIWDRLGDGGLGVFAAATALLVVPLTLIATFSPYAVKLLLLSLRASGRTAGRIYAVSTFGSIFGTLATTFLLIPNFGSRRITYVFATLVLLSALSMLWMRGRTRVRAQPIYENEAVAHDA